MSKKHKKRKLKRSFYLLTIFLITLIIIMIWLFIPKKTTQNSQTKQKVETQEKKKNENYNTVDKTKKNEYKLRDGEALVGTSSKGFAITKLNNIYYVDGTLIVNKTYPLPSTYQPINPYKQITSDYLYGGDYIENEVMKAYLKMAEDASKEGLTLKITSGYRSYKVQIDLYNNYANRDGKDAADTYSARPGHSEHQSGLCFDLNGTNENFISTKEGKWLNDNAQKYGFILRFPSGSEDKTGYMYEGWHFRYVGEELADKLYNNGNWISLEEYYGITSQYKN